MQIGWRIFHPGGEVAHPGGEVTHPGGVVLHPGGRCYTLLDARRRGVQYFCVFAISLGFSHDFDDADNTDHTNLKQEAI